MTVQEFTAITFAAPGWAWIFINKLNKLSDQQTYPWKNQNSNHQYLMVTKWSFLTNYFKTNFFAATHGGATGQDDLTFEVRVQ